jgi:hypothetical protein
MRVRVLCLVGDTDRWRKWQTHLGANGHTVLRAEDESQAINLLHSSRVDVICIDSQAMPATLPAEADPAGLNITYLSPRVPVVLIQTEADMPVHFERQVDVVTDEASFDTAGCWLIDDLHEVRFPLFVRWFNDWKLHCVQNESGSRQRSVQAN